MYVPLGLASLAVGVFGLGIYAYKRMSGIDVEFSLLVASLAAFVAGWVACITIPSLVRRLDPVQPISPADRTELQK
jgi:hypothetical protein